MARLSLLFLFLAGLPNALSVPLDDAAPPNDVATNSTVLTKSPALPAPLCFPSLGFVMPDVLPADNTDWWCDPAIEYAFLGFSYEITDCEHSFLPVIYSGALTDSHRPWCRPESRAAERGLPRYPAEFQLTLHPAVRLLRQRGLLVSARFLRAYGGAEWLLGCSNDVVSAAWDNGAFTNVLHCLSLSHPLFQPSAYTPSSG